jgi:hypothetical protein
VPDADARPALALAEPRTGPTPERTAPNATAVSRCDPDVKLRHKPGHRTHLVHRGQVVVDPKATVIVAVQGRARSPARRSNLSSRSPEPRSPATVA